MTHIDLQEELIEALSNYSLAFFLEGNEEETAKELLSKAVEAGQIDNANIIVKTLQNLVEIVGNKKAQWGWFEPIEWTFDVLENIASLFGNGIKKYDKAVIALAEKWERLSHGDSRLNGENLPFLDVAIEEWQKNENNLYVKEPSLTHRHCEKLLKENNKITTPEYIQNILDFLRELGVQNITGNKGESIQGVNFLLYFNNLNWEDVFKSDDSKNIVLKIIQAQFRINKRVFQREFENWEILHQRLGSNHWLFA